MHSQFIAVLPYIEQSDNIGMIEELHNYNLSLQSKWNDFANSKRGVPSFCTLDKICKAQGAILVCHSFWNDFGDGGFTSNCMPDFPNP